MESRITPIVELEASELSPSSATLSDSSTLQAGLSQNSGATSNSIHHTIGPSVTVTPRTQFAPEGRIVDDSARGTVFWEIYGDEEENQDEAPAPSIGSNMPPSPASSRNSFQACASFKIKWITTKKLPFYKARGIRNALNGNRDVKIARDGTEISSASGAQLLKLFHVGDQAVF